MNISVRTWTARLGKDNPDPRMLGTPQHGKPCSTRSVLRQQLCRSGCAGGAQLPAGRTHFVGAALDFATAQPRFVEEDEALDPCRIGAFMAS